MAQLTLARNSNPQHPRENLLITGNLASANAEVVVDSDGCSSFSLDLRGTFSGTMVIEGTVDGTNWMAIPVRPVNIATIAYLAAITGTTAGIWVGTCAGYMKIRARVSAYTSGTFITTLVAHNGLLDNTLTGLVTTGIGTNTGAASAAVTLTLAAPGAGLRHYITYLAINRFASALLTAAAAPVVVTTTNLPGTLAFSVPAEAAAQGTMDRYREDFAYPVASSAQNTATTIVCPVVTGVIWRVTAGFYVAP